MTIVMAFHTLAAVILVGGMFFAYVILRPSAGSLEPEIRLSLWSRLGLVTVVVGTSAILNA